MNKHISWKEELKNTSSNYHTIGCWVALIINFFWFISDYFIIPDHFAEFFVFRLGVSILILYVLFVKDNIKPELIGFIPVLALVFQNAYMYSVMDLNAFRNHTYGYVALFIGMGLLVLWRYIYTIAVIGFTLASNIVFFYLFSPLTLNEILVNGGMLAGAVAICTIALVQARYNLTKKEIMARTALSKSNKELAIQKGVIEEKNRDITDSISYAKSLQEAILPNSGEIEKVLKEHFIFYKPKDIVSGDFYWFTHKGDHTFIAACDCTGHGVPGGFLSMIGNDLLNQIILKQNIHDPGMILTQLNKEIKAVFTKEGEQEAQDGMDMALCVFQHDRNNPDIVTHLRFAGAYNSLFLIRQGIASMVNGEKDNGFASHGSDLLELKADKACIGGNTQLGYQFSTQHLDINQGDCIYLFSDGFLDQFGGRRGKKFTKKRFKEFLVSINQFNMKDQLEKLYSINAEWMGHEEQVDDMLVMGVRV